MASLNHVKMWTEENGWELITADQAAKIYPRGTISAKSGLFVCDLCGQYVTLTDGEIRDRYFKHSAYEESKDCPERTFGSGFSIPIRWFKETELPIKITDISDSMFYLEIGFLYVPQDILRKQKLKSVKIHLMGISKSFEYSFNRLNDNSITYLSVGNIPAKSYQIECDNNLHIYWPKEVKGIDPNGSVFDGITSIKLSQNADVKVGKKYLLLSNWSIRTKYENVKISKLSQRRDADWRTWYLYEVEATAFKEDAVKFFLDLHCRLTDKPLSFQPLWPIYNEEPCTVKHLGNHVMIHVSGEESIIIRSFPINRISYGYKGNGQVIKVDCVERRQLVTAGRTMTMQYLYIWNDPLNYTTKKPEISVADIKGNPLRGEMTDKMPYKNTMIVKAPFDGMIFISDNNRIKEKQMLSAEKLTVINNIEYGDTVDVFQGLDKIWSITILKKRNIEVEDDDILLKRLKEFYGPIIKINHNLGSIAEKLDLYPETKKWLYYQIQKGEICANALSYLKRFLDR